MQVLTLIEKIRLSLWDIVTFFMTGVLIIILITAMLLAKKFVFIEDILDFNKDIPTVTQLFVLPVFLTLLGLLVEPFANFYDRYLSRIVLFWVADARKTNDLDLKEMEIFIKENCLGELNFKIRSPFTICKEYVETKQLSTTFMVFLSRFGFYRNCSFLFFLSIPLFILLSYQNPAENIIVDVVPICFFYLASASFKRRGDEFYSYQAKSVYSAFLIDNLSWPAKNQNPETFNLNIGERSDL